MKNQSENVWGGALLSYEAPRVELIEVSVEKGFALSGESDTTESLSGEAEPWE